MNNKASTAHGLDHKGDEGSGEGPCHHVLEDLCRHKNENGNKNKAPSWDDPCARDRQDPSAHPSAHQFGKKNEAPSWDDPCAPERQDPSAHQSHAESEVFEIFDQTAPVYDRMNTALSFGLHRLWKADAVERLPWAQAQTGLVHVDMACGSGDIAFLVRRRARALGLESCHYLVDPNPAMLDLAVARFSGHQVPASQWHYVCRPAEDPGLDKESVDFYTIGFGLRNVQDRFAALTSARDMLRPGGWIIVLEFCPPAASPWPSGFNRYLDLLPQIGQTIAGLSDPYAYLADSIRAFITPHQLATELSQSGFCRVGFASLAPGCVAVHWAQRPQ
jgi:demethylmenaquinone methyltransferase / 2-methoxy-6-polyprenyl-1,4-benzoquinol methylase